LPAIIREQGFAVYVNFSDHPPPHCHVYAGGALIAVVSLATLEPIFPSQRLPGHIREVMAERIDELWAAFNDYNPPR
jgi:Domain of unknown function (DUF4160)